MRLLWNTYLVGALLYGGLVLFGAITDKQTPSNIIITAMLCTPIWPVVMVSVIIRIQRRKHK